MQEPPIIKKRARLGDFLIAQGLINLPQLQQALEYQQQTGMFLGESLISLGFISATTLGPYMKDLTTFPFVDLANYPINVHTACSVPEAFVRQKMLLPFDEQGRDVFVAMINPRDIVLVDDLRNRLNRHIIPHLVFKGDLQQAINRIYTTGQKVQSVLDEMTHDMEGEIDLPVDQLIVQAEDAPIVRLVNGIIQGPAAGGASDIHIDPQEENVRVRFRQDGLLYDQTSFSRQHLPAVISRIKIMANLNIAERRRPQDGRLICQDSNGNDIDLRVSLIPQIYGESVVMRLLDKRAAARGLIDLGMEKAVSAQVNSLIHQPHGLILVTGPTGSGKTTTLYAMLQALNNDERKIITVEDPVEYRLAGITQMQVNPHIRLTFSDGLRSIVRQDPDVILVGEIRDRETAETALQAAMTGHLVLSTLHTNDAPSALVRLQNMGIEPFLISSSVIGVLAQRLLRTVCPSCKGNAPLRPAPVQSSGVLQQETSVASRACAQCHGRGMHGRIAVYEVMPMSPLLGEMTLRRRSSQQIREQAMQEGYSPMRASAQRLMMKGITTREEIARVLSINDAEEDADNALLLAS